MEKTCNHCQTCKPISDFGRERPYRHLAMEGLAAECFYDTCKRCTGKLANARNYRENPQVYRQKADEWRDANPEKRKKAAREYGRRQRWGKFGCTPEQAEQLLERAGGRCESCNDELSDAIGITIDHCHTSDAVRGVLCAPCNKAEGFLKSDPARARRLADYLDRHLASASGGADLSAMTAVSSDAAHG